MSHISQAEPCKQMCGSEGPNLWGRSSCAEQIPSRAVKSRSFSRPFPSAHDICVQGLSGQTPRRDTLHADRVRKDGRALRIFDSMRRCSPDHYADCVRNWSGLFGLTISVVRQRTKSPYSMEPRSIAIRDSPYTIRSYTS